MRVPAEPERFSALEARLRDVLGAEAYEAAVPDGAALELASAVAWIRRARGARRRPSTGWESLTPVERQVVDLAAGGLRTRRSPSASSSRAAR